MSNSFCSKCTSKSLATAQLTSTDIPLLKNHAQKFSIPHRVYAWHTFLIISRKKFSFMIKYLSLPDALQNLTAKGYHLADSRIADRPDQSIQSNDWRLDSVQQVREENNGSSSLVIIAVSSVQQHLKLVFVEVMQQKSDFSPMNLLRKLFPVFQK